MAVLPKPRQRKRTPATGDKREAILEVAARLFFAQGYAHTGVEQIARELGVSKPFIYYYFGSKQDIFETLTQRPMQACFSAMDFAADDTRPAHVKLQQGLERLIGTVLAQYPVAFLAYLEPQVLRPAYLAAQRKLARHFYARLAELLEQGRRERTLEFTDARLTARAVSSLPGFLYTWYRPEGRLPPAELTRELVAMAWRLIGLQRAAPDLLTHAISTRVPAATTGKSSTPLPQRRRRLQTHHRELRNAQSD
jgi:AcrR family transcriptional regulator